MTPERWQRVKDVLVAALEKEEDQRTTFLEKACAGDEELRTEVEALIASHKQMGGFINTSPIGEMTFQLKVASDRIEGRQIGPYKVIRQVGHGGMGAVYLAARADDQYQKRVAIKLVKRGMDTDGILRRFRNERQILAGLDHPNIARLLDGGTTGDGLPYFVMEYIKGRPIDEYCDAHKLTIEERLKLFRQVCAAVQYAHQNLIVHRDLKPGNILVTTEGAPKLLDFGIAKLLNPELSRQTIDPTATALRLMTPEYASPEQVRGEGITTAADVYSLGVVLYQLLCGHRPYRVKSRAAAEIMRVVCDEEPERPSTAVNRVEEVATYDGAGRVTLTPEVVSKTRAGVPEKLRRTLAGDLDNIVMMALRKEPQRRYASVERLSEDIRRHLEGLPVIARKDTFGYRAEKFIKRHKAGAAAAALILLTLLVGIAATAWQASVARGERARAEQRFNDVRELANSFLFEFHDAIEELPGSTPARQLLVERALRYLDRLARDAGDDSSLQRELAAAYLKVGDVQGHPGNPNLGDTSGALQSYRKALAILEDLAAREPTNIDVRRNLGVCYDRIGGILQETGDTTGALEHFRKGMAISEALSAADPKNAEARRGLATGYANLGELLAMTGDMAGALESHRKALAIREEAAAQDPTNVQARRAVTLSYDDIAHILKETSDTAGALEHYRKALAVREELSAADPTNARFRRGLAISHAMIGDMLAATGDKTGAQESLRKSLAVFEALSVADPKNALARRDVALTYKKIGDQLTYSGDPRGALENYRKALAIREALSAADPANSKERKSVMTLYNDIADALGNPDFTNLGDTAGALNYYRRGLKIAEELAAADPTDVDARKDLWVSYSKMGEMLAVRGDKPGALESLRKALPIAEALSSADPKDAEARRQLGISHELIGNVLLGTGDTAGALENYRKSLTIREELSAADPTNAVARADLAIGYSRLGEVYDALASKAPATERGQHWHEARTWYQRSLELWSDLRNRGAIDSGYADQPDKIARAIARCDRELAQAGK